MTILELPLGWIHAFGFLWFVLSMLSVLSVYRALFRKNTGRYILANALLFAGCFSVVFCIEAYSRSVNFHRAVPDFCLRVMRLPVLPAVLAAFALLAVICILRARLDQTLRTRLTPYSVCQGLDMLPEGILFSTADGVPLLFNNVMRSVCAEAFGHAVLDYAYLKRRIDRREVEQGCLLEEHAYGYYLRLASGTVWDLREKEHTFTEGKVTELVAFNVTAFYKGNEELRERNRHLAEMNAQIREYTRNLDAIVRDKEILAAKIRLHDDFGKALLAIRSYLMQPEGGRAQVLSVLNAPVFLFRGEAQPEQTEDSLELLQEAANAIGARIVYNGELPTQHRNVTAVAIHECLTNTVKHAGGKQLTVTSRCTDGVWTVTLTNDGAPPVGTVAETGGLANLRRLAENNGLEMEIVSSPVFRLTLRF